MRYARVVNGVVSEIIVPHNNLDGKEYTLAQMFAPDFIAECVDVTALPDVKQNWLYDGASFSPPPAYVPTREDVRQQRDKLLRDSDFTQLDDSPKDKVAWRAYRKSLRDITTDFTSPDLVVWPTPPE